MFPDNRIREFRKKAGLSQAELGEKVGLHQTHVGNLENGRRELTFEWARRIAKALGVRFVDLLSDDDNPDRLAEDERDLVQNYRVADPTQREMVQRVASPYDGYKSESPEEDNGRRLQPRRVA